MAFYNQSYQPYSQPYTPYQPLDTGIIWVQGESGAKAYPVTAGKSMVLFDSESERFFIKSVDISGMPKPLRVFTYSEDSELLRGRPELDTAVFITREEFERELGEIRKNFGDSRDTDKRKGGNQNDKPLIQSTKQSSK